MITAKQINEIREHLERAQNPIFYYDNDVDGLCSFILLRRMIGRGKGVAIRSYPDLNAGYARRASELGADYVFVLDKPIISKGFIEEINSLGLPLVWIDHHELQGEKVEKEFENVYVYNPARNSGSSKSNEPTTYLAYKISERKEDLWLAVVGSISDRYLPDFIGEFKEKYPDYWGKVKDPFDAYYKTELGRIIAALSFGLKDSITNVVRMQSFLISCKGPEEIFSEFNSNMAFRKRYEEIKKKYDSLIERAKENVGKKLIFFDYSSVMSMSSDLANELTYTYPKKYVAVAYVNAGITNVSLRGKNVRAILERTLKQLENASGGGHEDAVGARIRTDDLEKFKNVLEAEIVNGKRK